MVQAIETMGVEDLKPSDRKILDALNEHEMGTPSAISEWAGVSDSHVHNRLDVLIAFGYVEKVHRGLYKLVSDPRDSK